MRGRGLRLPPPLHGAAEPLLEGMDLPEIPPALAHLTTGVRTDQAPVDDGGQLTPRVDGQGREIGRDGHAVAPHHEDAGAECPAVEGRKIR